MFMVPPSSTPGALKVISAMSWGLGSSSLWYLNIFQMGRFTIIVKTILIYPACMMTFSTSSFCPLFPCFEPAIAKTSLRSVRTFSLQWRMAHHTFQLRFFYSLSEQLLCALHDQVAEAVCCGDDVSVRDEGPSARRSIHHDLDHPGDVLAGAAAVDDAVQGPECFKKIFCIRNPRILFFLSQ